MGLPRPFGPARLVVGVIASRPEKRPLAHRSLEALFGPIEAESPLVEFCYTRYYEPEMGSPLYRYFLAFERQVTADSLVEAKLATNRLEQELCEAGKRTFNLDPGVLSLARLVLATTKDAGHRIPLAGGIYAELTLLYERGAYRPLPWTYPDYRADTAIAFFAAVRERLRRSLRAPGRGQGGTLPAPVSDR